MSAVARCAYSANIADVDGKVHVRSDSSTGDPLLDNVLGEIASSAAEYVRIPQSLGVSTVGKIVVCVRTGIATSYEPRMRRQRTRSSFRAPTPPFRPTPMSGGGGSFRCAALVTWHDHLEGLSLAHCRW
jgi:hypothetical protein